MFKKNICIIFMLVLIQITPIVFADLSLHEKSIFWYDRGDEFFLNKSYGRAINCFDNAILNDATNGTVWRSKSLCLLALSKVGDAESSIDKAIELDPESVLSWGTKSLILMKKGDFNESLSCVNKAIYIDSSYAPAWVTKGMILYELSRYNESIECYDNAIEADPTYAPSWLFKGMMFSPLGMYNESLDCYNNATDIDPMYGPAWVFKGSVLAVLGRFNESIKCWEKAAELDSKYKVLEIESSMFPPAKPSTQKLVVQGVLVDAKTYELLKKHVIYDWYCGPCQNTGKWECPDTSSTVTGKDIFQKFRDEGLILDDTSNLVFGTWFHECKLVCDMIGCVYNEETGNWTCDAKRGDCRSVNVDAYIHVCGGIVDAIMVRFSH